MKHIYKFYYYNLTKKQSKKRKIIKKNINKYLKFLFSIIEVEPPKELLNDLYMKI